MEKATALTQTQNVSKPRKFIVGVDIGGTFTDALAVNEEGDIFYSKVPTTPSNRRIGVMSSLERLASSLGTNVEELLRNTIKFAHGTTATVNAMVQRLGARTGLITTRGFRDTLNIMKVSRGVGLPDIEATEASEVRKPDPLVPYDLIEEVTERIDYSGNIVIPLDEADAVEAVRRLLDKKVGAIAVSLLWSFMNPVHEKRIREIVQGVEPSIFVSLGSDVAPVIGEYERAFTTVCNSFVGPFLSSYVNDLQQHLTSNGFPYQCLLMQSTGGLMPAQEAPQVAATTIVSGLAGGVVGSKYLGETYGYRNIITADMGGTSFEVGLVVDGTPQVAKYPLAPRLGPYINRWRMAVPTIDITAIGSGGGSIAWLDAGRLRVGPISAGAEPGPACYGRGGEEPTVTDADLVLGYLGADNFLGGTMKVFPENSVKALGKIASPLGLDVIDAARGVYDVVNNQMADLMRKLTVQRGLDPRDFILITFGGAGPMHVGSFGAELRVKEMLIPGKGLATAHSALGVAVSDLQASSILPVHMKMPFDAESMNSRYASLEAEVLDRLRQWGVDREKITLLRSADMRYGRQVYTIEVPVPSGPLNGGLVTQVYNSFEQSYETLYGKGTSFREAGIEATALKVTGVGWVPKPALREHPKADSDSRHALRVHRQVFFKDDFVETPIYTGERLAAGNTVQGPAVIEYYGTTLVVHPGQSALVDKYLNVGVRRE